uniref:NADH-ubiquinone oxidoreductase chain 4 n=1 Tax=Liposcelis nr. bostrychophila AZ TaxID=1643344 RepID=A0A0F6RAN2_9NEOP|nr:NADH dehydrogenase subunit 4 [Liposcelis nr. bostrychophila AZ]
MIQLLIFYFVILFLHKLESFFFFNLFYLDKISLFFNLLNLLIMFMFFFLNLKFWDFFFLMLLSFIMALVFMSQTLFQLYVYYELSLIPIFMIIINKGKQIERKKASLYLFFFTLFFSFPFLALVIYFKTQFFYSLLSTSNYNLNMSYMSIFLYLGFMAKLPIFFFHMWLPKAHVEAPVHGSMVLAGVMLKLGGYGLYKTILVSYKSWLHLGVWSKSILAMGVLIASVYCLMLSDLKIIIAVSSVSHMSLSALSMSVLSKEGMLGFFLMMISHGFLSPLLFFFANCLYERSKTRSIFLSKSSFSYLFSIFLLIILSANFCFPPSLNFFSEVMISLSLISWNKYILVFIFGYMLASTIYSIFIFIYLSKWSSKNFNSKEFFVSELSLMIMSLSLIFFFFLLISKKSY